MKVGANLTRETQKFVQTPSCFFRRLPYEFCGIVNIERQQRKALAEVVMKLRRDPSSLPLLGCNQHAAQPASPVTLCLQLQI